MHYNSVSNLQYETNCASITQTEWNKLMEGARRANKRKINALVKDHLPELYRDLALNLRNPYNYFKTKTHFVLVHSAIEYFLRIN